MAALPTGSNPLDPSLRFREIYENEAEIYDRLVSLEDHEKNLPRALQKAYPRLGSAERPPDVIEIGAGTGRLTAWLAPLCRQILAFDGAAPMLALAERKLAASGRRNWRLAVADNRKLPAFDACADLVIGGWTLGHLTEWHPAGWEAQVDLALAELRRVLRPGGTILLIETLGTGREEPEPPSESLARYYERLETRHGFERSTLRTDYRFATLAEAVQLTGFFFGAEMAEAIRRKGETVLPECTGIWRSPGLR